MVRNDAGKRYEDFRERNTVGIGFPEIAAHAKPGVDRKQLRDLYLQAQPGAKEQSALTAASQVFRFVNEISIGDFVVTYSPTNRTYLVGTVSGECTYTAQPEVESMELSRTVDWLPAEVNRDALSLASRNSLGSVLTVFRLADTTRGELVALASGKQPKPAEPNIDEKVEDPLNNLASVAFERIKDQISTLDWREMQDLVAGILRAMGYKTQVSPPGSDLGRDILASPDGFGLQQPRIVVEVKHRNGAMNSESIRSFVGGRHKDDRCLYVSTGGFTRDARYEADRSAVPLALWTLDDLARALQENYDNVDSSTTSLVALRRFYAPAN